MKVVCSYCRCSLPDKEPFDDSSVSHGMCENCLEHFAPQWRGQTLGEYLDMFDFPVFVVDMDRRMAAINTRMARLLGRQEREIVGLLQGEAIECVHSRLPGGCGRTVHCRTCTVRRAVEATAATGMAQTAIPAIIERDGQTWHVRISTQLREGGAVEVKVES